MNTMKLNRLLFSVFFGLLFVLPGVGVSHAQIASALIREGETLPGDSSGFLISDIMQHKAQNGVGGFAYNVKTFDVPGTGSTTQTISHLWGNTTGGAGTVLRSVSTFGNFEQFAFGQSGMSDAGVLANRASSTHTLSGSDLLQGLWLDSTLILNEEDEISTLPGNFSTNNDAVGITRSGTPYWRTSYSTTGGTSDGSAILLGDDLTVLLKSGDSIAGITQVVDSTTNAIRLDLRFSANGTNYINEVYVDTGGSTTNDGVMVSNGAALLAGGSVIREGSSVSASIGGFAGELYGNFDHFGITESGSYLITGDTDAAETLDEFIMIDGEIVLREGDEIDGLTLNGAIECAFQNEDGDWAAVWDVDFGTDNLEALIMNGEILLLAGDLVDWNNDGLIDGSDQNGFITDFTNSSRGLTLSDRDANGNVRLLFNADVDLNGTVLEGGFSMSFSAVPEPSSMMVLLLAVGPMLGRRRRRI